MSVERHREVVVVTDNAGKGQLREQKKDESHSEAKHRRRPYSPPRLVEYGNIRNLTTGGSPGVGDSGSARTRKPRS
jgi:hypothetical protein